MSCTNAQPDLSLWRRTLPVQAPVLSGVPRDLRPGIDSWKGKHPPFTLFSFSLLPLRDEHLWRQRAQGGDELAQRLFVVELDVEGVGRGAGRALRGLHHDAVRRLWRAPKH